MKKLLILALAFLVSGGVFAQISVSAGVQTDFGAVIDMNGGDPVWTFAPAGGGTFVQANIEIESVTGFVKFDVGGFYSANVTVALGSAELSTGYNILPWVQWSSVNFWGDNNWAFGGSASDSNAYIQFGMAGLYAGICDASNINGESTADWKMPGFYLGYDYEADAFSAGGAFAGTLRGGNNGTFPFMVNAHAKITLSPLTVGVNAALYGAPDNGFFAISDKISDGYGAGPIVKGPKAMVLEAMLDFGIELEPCTIGIAPGLVMNLADDKDNGGGMGVRIGASADFNLGGGFTFTPGVIYTNFIKEPSYTVVGITNLCIGATLSYSF
jgi:hypothetical protein